MELPLVVGVDGSDSSLQALDWAVDEAARHEAPLRLVHASLWERYEGATASFASERPAERIMAEHIVASATERALRRNAGLKVSGDIAATDAVSALLREGHEAFALVTGCRGRGEIAGLLIGTVSLAVAARAVCPVIVVRGTEQNLQDNMGRVLVGVGKADRGAAAVRFAFDEAEARGCALSAVRAWRWPSYDAADIAGVREEQATEALARELRDAAREHPAVRVHRQVTEGPAHKVLLRATADADLAVVGALRRHDHAGLQLGRVAHTLLHHAACPVAVVPQQS